MPGIDPSILAAIGGGNPTAPGVAGGPGGPESAPGAAAEEPGTVHDSCLEVVETLSALGQMLDDLNAKIQMEEGIDPEVETALADAAVKLAEVAELVSGAEAVLAGGGEEEEAPGSAAPPMEQPAA